MTKENKNQEKNQKTSPKKKRRKRVKRKPGKTSRMYFHQGTQDAIVKIQNSEKEEEKEKIYVKEVLPAFKELSENLIYVFGFRDLHQTTEELKSDCVSFLYEQLNKFDPNRGTKAYSYFSIVAKHFLMIRSKKRTIAIQKLSSFDDPESLLPEDIEAIEKKCIEIPVVYEEEYRKEKLNAIEKMLYEIKKELKTENEFACIDAIITIFNNLDQIEILKKRAIFLYVKELSRLDSKQLTVAMSSIRKIYKEKSGKFFTDIFSEIK